MPPIASRVGIDLNPVQVTEPSERPWLRALIWPENQHAATLLVAALEGVAADPPPMIAGDAIEVCLALGRSLAPGEPRVVFHKATRMHVPRSRRAAFDDAIDKIGQSGPLYHARLEPRGQATTASPTTPRALAFHGQGDREAIPIARADGHLEWEANPGSGR